MSLDDDQNQHSKHHYDQDQRRSTKATDDAERTVEEGRRLSKWNKTLCTDVKLIDFGGATYEDDHHTKTINTR